MRAPFLCVRCLVGIFGVHRASAYRLSAETRRDSSLNKEESQPKAPVDQRVCLASASSGKRPALCGLCHGSSSSCSRLSVWRGCLIGSQSELAVLTRCCEEDRRAACAKLVMDRDWWAVIVNRRSECAIVQELSSAYTQLFVKWALTVLLALSCTL